MTTLRPPRDLQPSPAADAGSAFDASPIGHLGADLFARLRTLAEAVEQRAARTSAPRVLIVPGLPGTSIGTRGRFVDDAVWLDPASVLRGRLTDLAFTAASPPLTALDVIPAIYLQLELRLQAAGYDVDFHPYDWRRSVVDLGRELAQRVQAEGREVHVVAHSFGGLVTRFALLQGATNLGRMILLGTPNHGTFSTVQGIRGEHWLLRSLSAFDSVHTTPELAAVFATFPSIYEQLPARRKLPSFDLYTPESWPAVGPSPRRDLLLRAPAIQDALAEVRGQLFLIAGHGRTTVDGLSMREGGFAYHRSTDGDGWVPASFVELDGVPTYYTTAAHIGMTNSEVVLSATLDLLATGETAQLPTSRPAGAPRSETLEARPMRPIFDGRKGIDLTRDDVSSLLGQLLSADPLGDD
jgi:pimeloyl-ACP methyl ester carboxylesterase